VQCPASSAGAQRRECAGDVTARNGAPAGPITRAYL